MRTNIQALVHFLLRQLVMNSLRPIRFHPGKRKALAQERLAAQGGGFRMFGISPPPHPLIEGTEKSVDNKEVPGRAVRESVGPRTVDAADLNNVRM